MTGPLSAQLDALRERYPDLEVRELPSGSVMVRIRALPLPAGWSKASTDVYVLAPVGFPHAQPDCFWADTDLRLANGQMPQAAQVNPLPEGPSDLLWFSWHLSQPWNPNRDTISSWVQVVLKRLREIK